MTYASVSPLPNRYEVIYYRCSELVNALGGRQLAEERNDSKGGSLAEREDVREQVKRKLGIDPSF